MSREDVFRFAADEFGTAPDYPWESTPDAAVLRHADSKKWYALIMNVGYNRLGINKDGSTDIINLKCDPLLSGSLILNDGIMPAYHMNKNQWISVLLDGTVDAEQLFSLIRVSYALTDSKKYARRKNKQ